MRGMIGGLLLATGLLVGCPSNDDEGETGDTSDVTTIFDGLEKREDCEVYVDAQGYVCDEFEGGTYHLLADIELNDDNTIGGAFYLVLVANTPMTNHENWLASDAAGERLCKVGAGLSGTWEAGSAPECPDCNRVITYNTTYAPSISDCPADFGTAWGQDIDGIEGGNWYLRVNNDETVQAFDTQNEWAPNGIGDESGVIVWSDGVCRWLYDDECEAPSD